MFCDVTPCQTTSKLHFYIDLMYHVLLGQAKGLSVMCEGLPVMCKGLSVMRHDCNHDSHVITMMS